jgi:hypothetical protein
MAEAHHASTPRRLPDPSDADRCGGLREHAATPAGAAADRSGAGATPGGAAGPDGGFAVGAPRLDGALAGGPVTWLAGRWRRTGKAGADVIDSDSISKS